MADKEITLVDSVHGIELGDYFRTLNEVARLGYSVNEENLDPFVDSILPMLHSLRPEKRWDVYEACIANAAAIYLGAHGRRTPGMRKFLSIHRMGNNEQYQTEIDKTSALYSVHRPGLMSAPNLPVGNAIVLSDLDATCKALKKGGKSLPNLCARSVSGNLTARDIASLLHAINATIITLSRRM